MSQLGCHIIRSAPQALAWAARAGIVKAIDNPTVLAAAPADAIRIHRHYFSTQSPYADARDIAAAILDSLHGYRHARLYAEVLNETPRELTAIYARLLLDVVPILHAAGVKVAGPSWATGDYDAEHWETMRGLGWCDLDAIALHAYWAGAGLTPWNALRYRQFWRSSDPPVMVTECGRDKVRDGPDGTMIGNGGWQRDGIGAEAYIEELARYEQELARDGVVGVVFTAGPTGDWAAFDTDGLDMSRFTGPARLALPPTGPTDREEIAMPIVGEGFRKAEPWVGPWQEDEIFHLPGQDGETSLAVGARGIAIWRRKDNRTVAVQDLASGGRVLDDYGNAGDGHLGMLR